MAIAMSLACFCLGNFAFHIALENNAANGTDVAYRKHFGEKTVEYPRLCGKIKHIQGLTGHRLRLIISDLEISHGQSLAGLAAWTWENPEAIPVVGQSACVSRKIMPIRGLSNFGLPDWDMPWAARGIAWRLWSKGTQGNPEFLGDGDRLPLLRQKIIEKVRTNLLYNDGHTPQAMPDGKAIILALLFGEKFYLDDSLNNAFNQAGLAHSLALSGQHLAVAAMLGYLAVYLLTRIYPRIVLYQPAKLLSLYAACPIAISYLWLGNSPPSLVRAACMLFAFACFMFMRSTVTCLDLLFSAILCISIFNPLNIFETGLQFSCLCVAIIAISIPWTREISARQGLMKKHSDLKTATFFLQLLLISAFIQIGLMPVSLTVFNRMGFWFPLNLIWIPLINFIIIPCAASGLVLSCLNMDTLAAIALNAASAPCQWMIDFLSWLQAHDLLAEPAVLRPHWTSIIAFAAIISAISMCAVQPCFRKIKKTRILILAGMAMLYAGPFLRIGHYLSDSIYINAFDVGQGQAVSLSLPGGQRVLVDGGGSHSHRFDPGRDVLTPALTHNHVPQLSAIINSHPDQDHLGGIFYLLDKFKFSIIVHNGRPANGENMLRWQNIQDSGNAIKACDSMRIQLWSAKDDLYLKILHPPCDTMPWNGNNASIVARLVRNGEGIAIFTGDAGLPVLRRLISESRDLRAKILIAPHHGSDRSFLVDFYRKVNPGLVLVCCGFANRYNYPGKKLAKFLAEEGIEMLDTGTAGQISLEISKNGKISVTTSRNVNINHF